MMFFTLCGYSPVVDDDGRVSPIMPNVRVAILTGGSVGEGSVIAPIAGWHTLLGEQLSPEGHAPQLSVPPQPSAIVPHEFVGHLFGVHVCVTHTLFVQTAFTAQVPQDSVPPHPSAIEPQFLPWAAHVVGVQPLPAWHVPFVHVSPVGHEQVRVPPHPFETVPHALPTPPDPQVSGTHADWQVPLLVALHVSPAAHPQFNVPPQPLGIVPHVSPGLPAGQVCVVQPHWLAVPPPPHVCGAVHVPQLTVPPLPSGIVPQLALAAMQSAGPLDEPVPHACGLAGGFGILHCVW
jgi:hypothetical protein